MFKPDSKGFIHPTGDKVGGHCTLIIGVNVRSGYYILHNSWGASWGDNGNCKIKRTDMAKLIGDNGEVCIITGRTLPPPLKKEAEADRRRDPARERLTGRGHSRSDLPAPQLRRPRRSARRPDHPAADGQDRPGPHRPAVRRLPGHRQDHHRPDPRRRPELRRRPTTLRHLPVLQGHLRRLQPRRAGDRRRQQRPGRRHPRPAPTGHVPPTGNYRIVILDEAQSISPAGFNALLKTLEEPPPNTVFILLTTEPTKILGTVASRCMPFTFKRLTIADIASRLAHIAQVEGYTVEPTCSPARRTRRRRHARRHHAASTRSPGSG
jgi:hypothetical protein